MMLPLPLQAKSSKSNSYSSNSGGGYMKLPLQETLAPMDLQHRNEMKALAFQLEKVIKHLQYMLHAHTHTHSGMCCSPVSARKFP
jgi:hypothetical protein